MLRVPFLTDLDPRRAVAGSRDPLGMQALWTHLGRHVVGNLSTVSTSVRDFTITVLGFHLVEKVVEVDGAGGDLGAFIRWEQLAGYARAAVNGETSFRGTERVHRNLEDGRPVTLSADREHQILGNQKIYGLWGLYTVPSRSSGLLGGDPPRPTPPAREHAERAWWPALTKAGLGDGRRIISLLREARGRLDVNGRDRDLVAAVAGLIRPRFTAEERAFYGHHLVRGGPDDGTGGVQRELAEMLESGGLGALEPLSPALIGGWTKEAARRPGTDGRLAAHLERVRVCESLLAAVGALFGWLLTQQGATLDSLADTVRRQWGPRVGRVEAERLRDLKSEFAAATGSDEVAARWIATADCLAMGQYRESLDLLLQQNRWVMSVRNGASPWAEARDGRLHVRFRDELGRLPDRDELRTLWRYPYFIDSLRSVLDTLRESAA